MTSSLDRQRIIVVGASRGLGRGIALALAQAGARVLAIARDADALATLPAAIDADACGSIDTLPGDATDAALATGTLAREDPDALFIVAGATPAMRPVHEQTWASFSENWQSDVKASFLWLTAAMKRPLRDGARVVIFSSGAAIHGSPLSGGYAPAKQAQRYLCRYARDELARAGRAIHVQCVLPQLSPHTSLGLAAATAYATRAGETPADHVNRRFGGDALTPALAGAEMVQLLTRPDRLAAAEWLLTGRGLATQEHAA